MTGADRQHTAHAANELSPAMGSCRETEYTVSMARGGKSVVPDVWEIDAGTGIMARSLADKVHAIAGDTLVDAAQKLAVRPAATGLKIESGEHLAAITLMAFGGDIVSVDVDGGFDFLLSDLGDRLFEGIRSAVVETKSAEGRWRKHWSDGGLEYEARVEDHLMVLTDQADAIQRAVDQIERKSYRKYVQSREAFILIHPLDRLTVPAISVNPKTIFEAALPIPRESLEIDGLWLFLYPNILTRWSQLRRCWTLYVIASKGEDEVEPPGFISAEKILIEGISEKIDNYQGFAWFEGLFD